MMRFQLKQINWVPVHLSSDELIGLTEASRLLGLSTSAVGNMCDIGRLRHVRDMSEPNPRKRGRVFRVDVEAERRRRRTRAAREDRRLKTHPA